MKPVAYPLNSVDQATEVFNLQEGLALLLTRQAIQTDTTLLQQWLNTWASETHQQVYGEATMRAVRAFQDQPRLAPTGAVDAATATALNTVLRDLGAFENTTAGQMRAVAGRVLQDDQSPFSGTVILF